MRTKRPILAILTALPLLLTMSTAFSAETVPGIGANEELIKTQQKADSLFEKGDYDRAMFIYREELAPLGDKFAQYMTGYMYYSGRGVDEDPVTAYAWYRLAAERSEESYVKSRDALATLLSAEQRLASDAVYADLREDIGDLALLTDLIKRDVDYLADRYGDEPFMAQALERTNPNRKDTEGYQEAVDRLNIRLDQFQDLLAADPTATAEERARAEKLIATGRREIAAFVASLEI